jgi:NAD(P)H-quinone oxidoreductase subunit 4
MNNFPWLTTIILFPILASLLIPIIPDKNGRTVRWYALIVGVLDFALIVYTFCTGFDTSSDKLQLVESYSWISQLDLRWSMGVDGLSMPLILLTGFITTLAILAAWPVTYKPKLFYFLMLGNVRRTDCRIRRTGYAAILPRVGVRTFTDLSIPIHLGREEATVRFD